MLREIFDRARRAMRARGRPDETDPRPPIEGQIKALVDELADHVARASQPSRVPWAFRPSVDRELFIQSIMGLVDDARAEAAAQVERDMSDRIGWECCCRCRGHGQIGCPICLNVYGCTVHSDVDPRHLMPDALEDPHYLARAVMTTFAELHGENIFADVDAEQMVETMRRVVCAPFIEGRRRDPQR